MHDDVTIDLGGGRQAPVELHVEAVGRVPLAGAVHREMHYAVRAEAVQIEVGVLGGDAPHAPKDGTSASCHHE